MADGWVFAIDRGGTFTDCIGVAPDGGVHVVKLLSSDTAPVEGVRRILAGAGVEPERVESAVRLGTTVATNALLERRGVPTLFVANRGLGDVLAIGTQERPDLFDLEIRKPPPLHVRVAEVPGRVAADGETLEPFDADAARQALLEARAAGIDSVAISLMHAYAYPDFEARLAALAREVGFAHVVASHEIAREMGLLARGETASVDAYLTPLLRAHVAVLSEALPGARLRLMQSSGGLTEAERFRGPFALLSGPAGGVVGAAHVAAAAGHARAVGFDMGGTSTDVSLLRDGEVDRSFETLVGGVRVKAPMLRIHTVAAGGGSLCRFDGFRLTVGPESAGADPGPLCYGPARSEPQANEVAPDKRAEPARSEPQANGVAPDKRAEPARSEPQANGVAPDKRAEPARSEPQAGEVALTDVNYFLGRVQPDRFPFALHRAPVERALARLGEALTAAGHPMEPDALAAGFVAVANAGMAQAIAQVSVARGVDPRDCALVGFGGAAGQHVCAIARELGMETVLLHPFAGILSAYGIGRAPVSWDGQRDAGRVPLDAALPAEVKSQLAELERTARQELAREGVDAAVAVERRLDLRCTGTETALAVREPEDGDWLAAFAAEHRARFGYERPGRPVEIVTTRLRASAVDPSWSRVVSPAPVGRGPAPPLREETVWFPEVGRVPVPVFAREALGSGQRLAGPALVLEDTGTIVLDPGFEAELGPEGILVLSDTEPSRGVEGRETRVAVDPIQLEVFGNRFMSIAEQMGAVLRNTSVSTNIKERLDYSCAVFDAEGGLVANAPHIPVHLGAMSETVRVVRDRFPDLAEDEAVVTNDPFAGGSHLPDVTVVTPVFAGGEQPTFFVASRGHHADIGGRTPGSMPADSVTLEEEGVVIAPFRLVRRGRFEEARVRELLAGARYPARSPDDNVAELEAMLAANRAGVALLLEGVAEHGRGAVDRMMRELQGAAAGKVAREIERLPDGRHEFADQLDDGTPVQVALEISGPRMTIDFAGTGAVHPGNLNAPPAVVNAAVIYVLRSLVAEHIPLNGGCLEPVEIRVPPGSLLDPPAGSAVVGGNVETSQRIVDVLLGALGAVAASQGTMNNVTFGDASFGYYETVGGGAGATAGHDGASGVHSHMTNTRITDAEVLEARHPVQLVEFSVRPGSGGAGRRRGGEGLVRRYRFLAPLTVSLLSERRTTRPWGIAGGGPGAPGRNVVELADGSERELPGCATAELGIGDGLRVETPGGGGFGEP